MDVQATLAILMRERPELVPALRAITELGTTQRDLTNLLLTQILSMQAELEHKRVLAKNLLVLRTGLCPATDTNETRAYSLRHIPDVMIRAICQIAEVPHFTRATTEWLDMMKAREEARPHGPYYSEVL